MKTKNPPKRNLLSEAHEIASGMFRAGLITKQRMGEYDALCLAPVPAYSSRKIKALRGRVHISQAVLAAVLNTSLSTVRQWEIGRKRPSGPSLKLLSLLDRKGLEALR